MQTDVLQLYFGDPYKINDGVIVYQPKISSIVEYGEQKYFSMIHTITAIPSDMKSALDDIGLDYEQLSDFDLFRILAGQLTPEQTSIVLGSLDLSKFCSVKNPQNDLIVLVDRDSGVVIDSLIYERIANYLRQLHGLKKKIEHAANKYTKKILIEEDRQRIAMNKDKPYQSFLMPLVSAVKCRQGYTLDYIKNMGLYEFFDDVHRLQIIDTADHLMQGCYAGTIDMKKIDKKELNWMREST